MSAYSVNQVRHLYVVNAANQFTAGKDLEGNLFFNLKDAQGKDVRSDLITHVSYAKATSADTLARKSKVVKIAFASGADCVAGQDYVASIKTKGFISDADESIYVETGAARAEDTTKGKLLLALAKNLAKNTAKQGIVSISVLETATEKTIEAATAGSVTAILVKEIEQPWRRGVKESKPVNFDVQTAPAKLTSAATVEGTWAAVTDVTDTYGTRIGNGKKTADLEWFCMGERASEYREKGWPYNWETEYMVDPSKEYDYVDIHYAYVGSNHAIQASEKDITIVCPVGTGATAHTVMANVLAKINSLDVITILDPSDIEAEE